MPGQGAHLLFRIASWVEPLGIGSSARPSRLTVPGDSKLGQEGAGQGRGWQWV